MSFAMPPPLLLLQDISLSFGMSPLLEGAGLAVAAGDRICLVGRNGSGKSTLRALLLAAPNPAPWRSIATENDTTYGNPRLLYRRLVGVGSRRRLAETAPTSL